MPIICPHCATSYAVDPATLGGGRNVRCARCKKIWLAQPQPSLLALVASSHAHDTNAPAAFAPIEPETMIEGEPPSIESPPLAVAWPADRRALIAANDSAPGAIIEGEAIASTIALAPRRTRKKKPWSIMPTATVAMCALIAALIVWRAEMVRLMPQTAGFYRIIGLDVNQRGLLLRDVKLSTESADGKPVLIVEGAVESRRRASVVIPQLHFVVRNAAGTVIYGWNATPDQAALQPGETTLFRSRLASPPADAHSIDVRFLHKRDLAIGAA